jgi:hypothetical protein
MSLSFATDLLVVDLGLLALRRIFIRSPYTATGNALSTVPLS